MQSVLSLSSHLSVDGLIVSGVAGGGVLGGARPVVVTDDVIVVIAAAVVVGVHGDPSVVVDDLGGDRLPTSASEGDLDELLLVLLVVGDDGAAAEAVDALGVVALVL